MFLAFSENHSIFSHEILYRCSWYYSHYTIFFSYHLEGEVSLLQAIIFFMKFSTDVLDITLVLQH